MKLSTKGRYGLRAILDVSLNQHTGPVTISSISKRQNLSERYLEQLLITLKQNGLIKSIRGFQGGYILGKDPENITVGDVIRALEGPISPVDCVNDAHDTGCSRAEFCVTKRVWEELKNAMVNVLDSYTLASLMEEYNKMSCNSFDHYSI
ncbi:Rrf2 family transcriptional regulator [Dehalobacter sp. DCM]|uniref:RrF2 family transcriptional regulator n=1 Tax=Dehalobacter sp. DCM TaxID=2907827 RepID=UPI00308147B8|nr:Rrf2 family transcriptional regulator [Dehalobacter sp. DCM]